jgi:hypothetical protein
VGLVPLDRAIPEMADLAQKHGGTEEEELTKSDEKDNESTTLGW